MQQLTVEAEDLVAHAVQDVKGLVGGEVLKLDQHVGPLVLGCHAELLDNRHVLLAIQPVLLVALCGRHRSSAHTANKDTLLLALICTEISIWLAFSAQQSIIKQGREQKGPS